MAERHKSKSTGGFFHSDLSPCKKAGGREGVKGAEPGISCRIQRDLFDSTAAARLQYSHIGGRLRLKGAMVSLLQSAITDACKGPFA